MSRLRFGILALLGLALLPGRASAAELQLTEAPAAGFPDRSYLLTLPSKQALDPTDVVLEENGVRVRDVELSPGGRSGVVLAIDTSESMHGRAIEDAMAAAREFATRRRADQLLGVVFFSRTPRVALEPTAEGGRIADVLGQTPALSRGTRIHDAADAAIALIDKAQLDAASVVVLSDGADVGSVLSSAGVVEKARESRVRIFSIGLRSSSSYESSALRAIAATGEYAEAASAESLAGIFARLSERLASEYIVSYRAPSPLGSKVAVSLRVKGIDGVATVAYQAPALPIGARVPRSEQSGWRSTGAAVAVAALVSLLLGFALLLLVRPRPKTLRQRITTFAPDEPDDAPAPLREVSAVPALVAADQWLERIKRWEAFKLDVELAKLKLSAMRILVLTAAVTLVLTAVFWMALDNVLMAITVLIALPISVRALIAYAAGKVRRRFEEQLPDNLQVLASALRAGHSFVGALNLMVADAPEPSRKEYRRVVNDEQLGVPIEESMQVVADRMRCEDVIYIGLIATLQRESGGNTAEVLDKVVETMRERAKLRRLVRTLTVQGRLGGWIVTALPISMVVFLTLAKPDYMDPMTEKPIGIAVLVLAAVLVVVGARSIQKIVDIKV